MCFVDYNCAETPRIVPLHQAIGTEGVVCRNGPVGTQSPVLVTSIQHAPPIIQPDSHIGKPASLILALLQLHTQPQPHSAHKAFFRICWSYRPIQQLQNRLICLMGEFDVANEDQDLVARWRFRIGRGGVCPESSKKGYKVCARCDVGQIRCRPRLVACNSQHDRLPASGRAAHTQPP